MKEFGKMYSLLGSHKPCLHTRNLCKGNLSRGVDIIYNFHPCLGTRLLVQTQPRTAVQFLLKVREKTWSKISHGSPH